MDSLAAIEFNGIGNPWMAMKYARLAVEAGLLSHGPSHPHFAEVQLLLKDPTTHWSWMWRSNQTSQG